jgi:glucosylceramidase
VFDIVAVEDDVYNRSKIILLNHLETADDLCLVLLELKNDGGMYGRQGGAQVTLGKCSAESALWKLDQEIGSASSIFFSTPEVDREVCMTTGWPFLQMGAFLTPNHDGDDSVAFNKSVIILNEAKDAANYALKDGDNVVVTGSIPPRSIQTVLLGKSMYS